MKLNRNLLLALSLLFFAISSKAQTRAVLEEQAYGYLEAHNYVKAYDAFDNLCARYPQEMLYQFNLGYCCLNYPAKKIRAIELFKNLKTNYATLEVEAYLGFAYHRNYKFDEAIKTLRPLVELLSSSKKREDKELLSLVEVTLMNCDNGKTLTSNKVIAEIENIGGPVNTPEIEGVPVITADESLMIFTYVGEKSTGGRVNTSLQSDPKGLLLSDIYFSRKDSSGTKWTKPEPMKSLNSIGNDAVIALSPDGNTLFTFRSDNKNEGDIYVSKLKGSEFGQPVPLNANINTPDEWEGSCSISADGKQLYFASSRAGGFGGRDLYVSELLNGDWGPAVNLGPKINTKYDDDAPFIHTDGITLFFSSQGHLSIGGYDIMYTIKEGTDWMVPRSMGIPLNTVEDDSYYVINSKGDKGFFSSGRDAKGAQGDLDIYMVTPGILGEKPVVALLKGVVYGNDKPIAAKIEIKKVGTTEKLTAFNVQSENGKYLTVLKPGFNYQLEVSADGFTSVSEEFDIEKLGTYLEKVKDFYLYTATIVPSPTLAKTATIVPTATIAASSTSSPEPEKVATATPTLAPERMKEEVKAIEPDPLMVTAKKGAEKKKNSASAPVKKDMTEPKSENCSSVLGNLSDIKGKSLNDEEVYKVLLDRMGNYCAANIRYTVQIGAYKHPAKFKTDKLKDLGKITSETYPDSLTRFIQNEFITLNVAEKNRQKLIARGLKDAWIIAFIGGKRYTLEDLIMVDFLGRPIN